MKFWPFWSQYWGAIRQAGRGPIVRRYELGSRHLGRSVELVVYRPAILPTKPIPLLLCLDGQDLGRMQIEEKLNGWYRQHPQKRFLLIGLVAADRLREYGTADRPDYKGRGDRSRAHQDFITDELMPWLQKRFNVERRLEGRAIIGFSLGGLHAFDLAWRRPDLFGTVGVFSGALWWRHSPFDQTDPDAGRIVHTYVSETRQPSQHIRVWLMAGTEDEKEDRNKNGVIDAIDDSLHLQSILSEHGLTTPDRLSYHQEEGGQHEPETWGKVMPVFWGWWMKI